MLRSRSGRRAGLTLLDITFTLGLLGILAGLMASAVLESQRAVLDQELVGDLRERAQTALDRLTLLVGNVTTGDAQYTALQPESGGSGYHALQFQAVDAIDVSTGLPTYSPDLVYVFGGEPSDTLTCPGLVIGRGSSLANVHATGRGTDDILGTADDRVDLFTTDGNPVVDLLIPARFAPQLGDLFVLDVAPAPAGRLLTFTLRLNAQSRDGTFILPTDLVVTQRVALRQ